MFSLIFIKSCNGRMDIPMSDSDISLLAERNQDFKSYNQEIGTTKNDLLIIINNEFGKNMDRMADIIKRLLENPTADDKERLEREVMYLNFLASIFNHFLGKGINYNKPNVKFDEYYEGLNIVKKAKMLIKAFDLDYVWREEISKEESLVICDSITDKGLEISEEKSKPVTRSKYIKLSEVLLKSSIASSSVTIEKAADILKKMSKEKINADLIEKEYSKILGLEKLTDKWKDNFKSIKDLFDSISRDIELCAKLAKEKSFVASTKATEDKDVKISLESVKPDEKIKDQLSDTSTFELILTEDEVQLKVQKAMDTLKAEVKKKLDKRLQEKKEKDDAIKAIKDESDRRIREEEQKVAEEKRLKESKYNLVLGKAMLKESITPEEDVLVLGEGKNTLEFKIISNAKNQVAILSNNIFYEKRNKKRKIDQLIDKNNENIRLDKGNDGKISMIVKDINGDQKIIKLKIVKSDQPSLFNLKSDYHNKDFDGIN